MNDYETQETPSGGTFHLHHKRRPAQKDMAFKAEPLALVAEVAVDQQRVQAEAKERADNEQARKQFHEQHQLTLV